MRWITLFMMLQLNVSLSAQDSLAQHGGRIIHAGYYKLEFVNCTDYMEVYLYEGEWVPVTNHGLSGYVDFYGLDNSCHVSQLYPYSIDRFTAEFPGVAYSHFEILIQGRGMNIKATVKTSPSKSGN